MDTTFPKIYKLRRIFTFLLSVVVIAAVSIPVTTIVLAAPVSPFLGKWEAVDLDDSLMSMSIGGSPDGPFQITWTDSYISYCGGEAGLLRGTGWLSPDDPNLLEADLHLQCFTTGASLDLHLAFRAHPAAGTLSVRYEFGQVTIWHRPGRPSAPPPDFYLRTNYGDDWVESFYEAGHMVWIIVTEEDGSTMKATIELTTAPRDDWGGEPGFQTTEATWIDPQGNPMENPPDIQAYNWVYGWVDNGAAAQMQVGEINAKIDLSDNIVTGTVTAPWFDSTVETECLDWGSGVGYPNKNSGRIMPDGIETFTCVWDDWDIQPGQTVGVGYAGPDGHWVGYPFAVNPRIVASEAGDWFWVTEFYPGPLDIFIYVSSGEGAALLWSGQVTVEDLWGITSIGPEVHELDLLPGNYLVISDGVNQKELVLETISMVVFDIDNDYMAGFAPPGRDVWAWAGPQEWQQPLDAVEDPLTGAWEADFKSIGFDITAEMYTWSYAHIYDDDGDSNEAGAPPLP